MSDYSIVPNAALTATADAIRTKSGSQATIEFDHNTGFASAVNDIPTGGDIFNKSWPTGAVTTSVLSISDYVLYERTAVTSVSAPNAVQVGTGAFWGASGMTSISLPSATTIGGNAIRSCSALTSLSLPSATTIGNEAFQWNIEITSADLPLVETVGNNIFAHCKKLSSINMPIVRTFNGSNTFEDTAITVLHFDMATTHPGCRASNVEILVMPRLVTFRSDGIWESKMQILDYGSPDITSGFSITSYDFDGPKTMQTIILRYGAVLPIQANTFYGQAFHDANYPGTLYVPQNLVSSYLNATNWSVVLSSYGNQVLPIEGSYYETHYADGTTIPTI